MRSNHLHTRSQSVAETTKEIQEHYDKGNDVFSCMMGKAMVYTCGIFHTVPGFASDKYKGDYKASAGDSALEVAQVQSVCISECVFVSVCFREMNVCVYFRSLHPRLCV